jgi:hypothetical protein
LKLAKVHHHFSGIAHGCWCGVVQLFYSVLCCLLQVSAGRGFESVFPGMCGVQLYTLKNWQAPACLDSKAKYERRPDTKLTRD